MALLLLQEANRFLLQRELRAALVLRRQVAEHVFDAADVRHVLHGELRLSLHFLSWQARVLGRLVRLLMWLHHGPALKAFDPH